MDIIKTKEHVYFEDVKIIQFKRHKDERGYFSETSRAQTPLNLEFKQTNESFSKANVIRGLHIQQGMGKLVRLVTGKMIDLFLDTRVGSKTYGRIGSYAMERNPEDGFSEWIWIPDGFAHGMLFEKNSLVEYFCTEAFDQSKDKAINIFSKDINWEHVEPALKQKVRLTGYFGGLIMSDKDKRAKHFGEWNK